MSRTLAALAAQFALRGRDALVRTALIAVGTGLAVALLLLASSVPAALAARDARGDAQTAVGSDARASSRTLTYGEVDFTLDGSSVTGGVAAPHGPRPPLPPGVARLPGNHEMLVSPALRRLLDSPGSAAIRARLPYRLVGEIAPAGLLGPTDLRFFAIDDRLASASASASGATSEVTRFGQPSERRPLDPVLALVLVIGVLVLLLPVGVIVTIAGRFGAERRDLRLASLRLLGLSARSTTALALLEAGIAAVAGDLVGVGVFAVARASLGSFSINTLSVFPSDAAPPLALAALTLVAVPLLAVGAALVSLRAVTIEPLGVARRARTPRRRVWWRLIPMVAAAPLLLNSVGGFTSVTGGSVPAVAGGVALLLVGTLLLIPWLTDRIAGLGSVGAMSWQLATRRIRHGGSTTSRVVGAVSIALAGAIALQMLFTGLSAGYSSSTGQRDSPDALTVSSSAASGADALDLAGSLQRLSTGEARTFITTTARATASPHAVETVVVASCATIRKAGVARHCADGDVFATSRATARAFAGRRVAELATSAVRWSVPTRVPVIAPDADTELATMEALIATPGSLNVRALHDVDVITTVTAPPGSAALTAVVAAAVSSDPLVQIDPVVSATRDHQYLGIQRGLTVGLILVMLLIGGVLLVSIGDQLRERRPLLASLSAVGMPRAVMVRSILWETAIPVVVGVVLAVGVGVALGKVLLAITSRSAFSIDLATTAVCISIALAVPVAVTVLSLPAATRSMRPDGLRAE